MRILIAGLWAATEPSGICRTIVNLVSGLNNAAPDARIVLAIGEWQREYFEKAMGLGSLQVEVAEVKIRNTSLQRNWWYMFGLPPLAQKTEADVLHLSFPAPVLRGLVGRPIVTTLHDLYPYDAAENFGFPHVLGNRMALMRALRASDRIACVSETTANRLHDRFPRLAAKKAVHIPNSIGIQERGTQTRLAIDRPFFLTVAQHRANKNLDLLLRSFQTYRCLPQSNADMRLVIVGARGPETPRLHALIDQFSLHDRVFLLSNLADAELSSLYAACELFVTLSKLEGFGLSLGEALAHGARVVASDIPAHREVAGANCGYVNLGEENECFDIAMTLSRVSQQEKTSRDHRLSCNSAAQFAQLYRELVQTPSEEVAYTAAKSSAWGKQ